MPLRVRRFLRKMRGGAQAHLLEAEDGHCYVVKFRNNPQHRRILVNEWVSATFLGHLRISAPEAAFLDVTEDFLQDNPGVHMALGQKRVPVEPGWHFGSRYPGDPALLAVYDFLPDTLLPSVLNLHEFLGALVFDKWMGNADSRQAIFFRAVVRPWAPQPAGQGFVAAMIDHGYVLGGPNWTFADSPVQGLYFRRLVYETVTGLDHFQPWLDMVQHFPEEVVDQALRGLPPQWLNGDMATLESLLEKLMRRRPRVSGLIEECAREKSGVFPRWRAAGVR